MIDNVNGAMKSTSATRARLKLFMQNQNQTPAGRTEWAQRTQRTLTAMPGVKRGRVARQRRQIIDDIVDINLSESLAWQSL